MSEQNNQKEILSKDNALIAEVNAEKITFSEEELLTRTEKEKVSKIISLQDIKIENTLNEYISIAKNFYGGFFIRLSAYIVDIIIVAALSALLNTLTFGLLDIGYELPVLGYTLPKAITYLLYFFLMTYVFSQTLGKMIFKLKVEKNNGDKLSLADTFYRETVGRFLSIALFFLPYLAIMFSDKKKGLHDYIADTVVIKEDFVNLRTKLNAALKAINE